MSETSSNISNARSWLHTLKVFSLFAFAGGGELLTSIVIFCSYQVLKTLRKSYRFYSCSIPRLLLINRLSNNLLIFRTASEISSA